MSISVHGDIAINGEIWFTVWFDLPIISDRGREANLLTRTRYIRPINFSTTSAGHIASNHIMKVEPGGRVLDEHCPICIKDN